MTRIKKQPDPRHIVFKDILFRCHRYMNGGRECPWDGSDAKQLDLVLKANPTLTRDEFYLWMVNYSDSENNPADRPRKFLPNITSYANGPLDKYGKPLVVPKRRIL